MVAKIRNSKYYSIIKLIISVLIPFLFASYNAILGFMYNTLWNKSIFIYYVLLVLVRLLLISFLKAKNNKLINFIYVISFIILILLNIALIIPSILMIRSLKPINIGSIPSIAMAAYTFYSITISIIEIKKYENDNNILFKQLKLVSLINAIVSILSLQNTLIIVNGEMNSKMITLSSVSTIGLLILILFLCIHSFIRVNSKR